MLFKLLERRELRVTLVVVAEKELQLDVLKLVCCQVPHGCCRVIAVLGGTFEHHRARSEIFEMRGVMAIPSGQTKTLHHTVLDSAYPGARRADMHSAVLQQLHTGSQ